MRYLWRGKSIYKVSIALRMGVPCFYPPGGRKRLSLIQMILLTHIRSWIRI